MNKSLKGNEKKKKTERKKENGVRVCVRESVCGNRMGRERARKGRDKKRTVLVRDVCVCVCEREKEKKKKKKRVRKVKRRD